MPSYHFQMGLHPEKEEVIVSIHYKHKERNRAIKTSLPIDYTTKQMQGCKDTLEMGMRIRGFDDL